MPSSSSSSNLRNSSLASQRKLHQRQFDSQPTSPLLSGHRSPQSLNSASTAMTSVSPRPHPRQQQRVNLNNVYQEPFEAEGSSLHLVRKGNCRELEIRSRQRESENLVVPSSTSSERRRKRESHANDFVGRKPRDAIARFSFQLHTEDHA